MIDVRLACADGRAAALLAEWARLLDATTASAAQLDPARPVAGHLRTPAGHAHTALNQWRAGIPVADSEHAGFVRAMDLAAAGSHRARRSTPRRGAAVREMLAAHPPGSHVRRDPLGDDRLTLDVGHVVLRRWLAEWLIHPEALQALAAAARSLTTTPPTIGNRLPILPNTMGM